VQFIAADFNDLDLTCVEELLVDEVHNNFGLEHLALISARVVVLRSELDLALL